MINIAVCDDDRIMSEFICETVRNEYSGYTDDFTVDILDTPICMEQDSPAFSYDVLFLDIDMPEVSGFDVAERLNSISPDTIIIFVTSHDELVYSSIKFKPFRFIRKTHLKTELPEAVSASMEILRKKDNGKKIKFQTKDSDIFLELKSITYFEIYSHTVLIHLENGKVYECIGNLSDFEEQFSSADFVRTHKSYLINCQYILSVGTTDITMDDNTLIPLSRYKSKSVKAKYIDYLRRN